MATLLPSITTGLKPVAGSLSDPGLGWLAHGLQPLGTSLGLSGTLLLLEVRVWQVFISSSRMSLVWASWRRLSSTLRMSLWEYPSLRNRSTLACCCWWSIVDADSGCSLVSVFSALSVWGILLASLLWFLSTSTATACVLEQLTGVKRGGAEAEAATVNTRSPSCFFFSQSDTTSWLQAQEQTLADVMPVKKAPVTHTLTQRGSRGSALIPGLILPPVSFGSVSKTNMNGTDVSLMLLASPNSTHVLLLFMETPWTSLLRVKTVEWLNHHFFHFISPTKQHKALTGCYTRNNENTKQATERACRVYKKSPS